MLAEFFAQPSINWSDDSCPPVFRLPSSGWDPRTDERYDFKPSPGTDEFLRRVRDSYLQRFQKTPKPIYNLNRRQRDVLFELMHRHDIVMVQTDKNLGMA